MGWRDHLKHHWERRWHYLIMVIFICTHSALLYGVDTNENGCSRGDTSVTCNAASYVDSHFFGKDHLYFPSNGGNFEEKEMTFQRTTDCSTCHPGRCIPPADAPAYCGYDSLKGGKPFDPEGLLSSFGAVCASLFGATTGHILSSIENKYDRLINWACSGIIQACLGSLLILTGLPLNPNLYSLSFLFLTNGVVIIILSIISWAVDPSTDTTSGAQDGNENENENGDENDSIKCRESQPRITICKPIFLFLAKPFRWLGLNSILIYLLSCTDMLQWLFSLVYWDNEDNCATNAFWPTGVWWGITGGSDGYVPSRTKELPESSTAVLCWCLFIYIPLWMTVAGVLHYYKYYFKV
jgi:hexosaminidase